MFNTDGNIKRKSTVLYKNKLNAGSSLLFETFKNKSLVHLKPHNKEYNPHVQISSRAVTPYYHFILLLGCYRFPLFKRQT